MKTADLCLGQRYIWLRHHQAPSGARHDTHIIGRFDLPPGTTTASVRATIGYLVRRHEALRTTYHHDADADPQQRVHPPAAVELVEVTAERDGTPSPPDVLEELRTRAFDLAHEWPVRACVVTRDGAPRQLVLVLNHMAFDAWTMDRLERELGALGAGVAARRPAALDPVRRQPLDLARHESSEQAAEGHEQAAAYWRKQVAALPADLFARRRQPEERRVHAASLTSPALLTATRRIADRHRVWPSLVHTAGYVCLLAACTGSERVGHLAFDGNRDENPFASVMTCMFSPVLRQVDCSGDPAFSTVLERLAAAVHEARGFTGMSYDALLELLALEGFRRGEELRVGSEFNFLSLAGHRTGTRRTRFTPAVPPEAWGAYGSDTYTRITEFTDAVVIIHHASAAVMGADDVERFLRGYEAVLLAHEDPALDLRLAEIGSLAGFPALPAAAAPLDAGRPGGAAVAEPGALDALLAAICRANRLLAAEPADCYVTAGGRVLRIPRVLDLLAEEGWHGLRVHDLALGLPLRTLAPRLTVRQRG